MLFAGTREGRELADFFSREKIPALVCVATVYGEELIESGEWVEVLQGRLDRAEMLALLEEEKPLAVIDATHPYAQIVTENIAKVCSDAGILSMRLVREETDLAEIPGIRCFSSPAEASAWLEGQTGQILLTTGIKELPVFAENISQRERLCIRTLLQQEVLTRVQEYGIPKKQVICMQGPFSREMNEATLRMMNAAFLVTKESGVTGGFMEKVEAAKACGACCVVIRRPLQERGYTQEEICRQLRCLWEKEKDDALDAGEHLRHEPTAENRSCPCENRTEPDLLEGEGLLGNKECGIANKSESGFLGEESLLGNKRCVVENKIESDSPRDAETEKKPRQITLLGIGMGAGENLTLEGEAACREADCIIGARRMLKTVKVYGRPMAMLYKTEEIAEFLRSHPEYRRVVIALSGDVGFYSGAKKLIEKLQVQEIRERREADFSGESAASTMEGAPEIRLLCGISTVSYFAAKLKLSWEDMHLLSLHGRAANLVRAVSRHPKVFVLASEGKSIREIARRLTDFGLGETPMAVGGNLSYPNEEIWQKTAAEFLDFSGEGVFAVILCRKTGETEYVTPGIGDDAFIRGKVPMTKEEVRAISVSKLRLCSDSVVYDIGAGTGSVAIECGRMVENGRVFAIEYKEEALDLLEQNSKKFRVDNVEIVAGKAPEAMTDLPVPTHAFIGGSGGNMGEILAMLLAKNPQIRIVVNCIALETLQETRDAAMSLGIPVEEVTQISVARAKKMGNYHLMMGQNPVYVICLQKAQGQ